MMTPFYCSGLMNRGIQTVVRQSDIVTAVKMATPSTFWTDVMVFLLVHHIYLIFQWSKRPPFVHVYRYSRQDAFAINVADMC